MGMKYRDYSSDSGEEYEGTRRRRGERRILSDSKSKKSLSDFQFERPDPITAAKTKANRERQRRERLNERCIVSPAIANVFYDVTLLWTPLPPPFFSSFSWQTCTSVTQSFVAAAAMRPSRCNLALTKTCSSYKRPCIPQSSLCLQ